MMATRASSPREHRDAIARQATVLLGLDGSNNWVHGVLCKMVYEGVFANAIDVEQMIGPERSAVLRGLLVGADRPEFRKAGMVVSTKEVLVATVDLWLDPGASEGAYALACEPIVLALLLDRSVNRLVLLFEVSVWSKHRDAFASIMAEGTVVGSGVEKVEKPAVL